MIDKTAGTLLLLSILFPSLLVGCLQDESQPTSGEVLTLDPGDAGQTPMHTLTVNAPVGLPDEYSSEPSLAITDDGTIAVAGPAGSGSNPTVIPYGGYVWVSHDDGQSFDLVLNPRDPDPPAGPCSCDTDILAAGDDLLASTMYWSVQPAFDANLVASQDGGDTWDLRSLAISKTRAVDRPWIDLDAQGELYAIYREATGLHHATPADAEVQPFIKHSPDMGNSWSLAQPIPKESPGRSYQALHPASLYPDRILIPLQRKVAADSGGVLLENLVAVTDDRGTTFETMPLSDPYPSFAAFDFSLATDGENTAIAVWSAPNPDNGPNQLHIRTSYDKGDTWTPTQQINLPGNAVQPWVAISDTGLVAIAYHGSPDDRNLMSIDEDTPWGPRVLITNLSTPTQPLAVIDPAGAPTYHGYMCNGGTRCPVQAPGRTPMFEFLSTEWAPDGDLFVAWTDARERPPDDRLAGRLTVTQIDVDHQNENPAENTNGDPTTTCLPPEGISDPATQPRLGPPAPCEMITHDP